MNWILLIDNQALGIGKQNEDGSWKIAGAIDSIDMTKVQPVMSVHGAYAISCNAPAKVEDCIRCKIVGKMCVSCEQAYRNLGLFVVRQLRSDYAALRELPDTRDNPSDTCSSGA